MSDTSPKKDMYELSKDFDSRIWVMYDTIEAIGRRGYHHDIRYAAALRIAHLDIWRHLQDGNTISALRVMASFYALFHGDLDEGDYDARGIAVLNARPEKKITYSR